MNLKGIFSSLDISASGLSVQRKRMEVTASNLANVNTTRTEEGGPYRRRSVIVREAKWRVAFRSLMEKNKTRLAITNENHLPSAKMNTNLERQSLAGVEIAGEVRDPSPPLLKYDPQHPDADENGYVALPNINVVAEMVELISATRSYEANVTAIDAAKSMAKKALEI